MRIYRPERKASLREEVAQHCECESECGGFYSSKALDEPELVDRTNLFKQDEARPAGKVRGNSERGRAAPTGERDDGDQSQVGIKLIWGDNKNRPGLLDFSSNRWIQAG